jgi:integrase
MDLTAKTIAGLTLPEGKSDFIIWDDRLPGFGYRLRAGAGGKTLASWVVQYRFAGRSRRVLIGNAAIMNAADARDKARKLLGKVANGEYPQANKSERRARDAVSFASTVKEYLAAKQAEVKPKTFRDISRYLTDRRYFGGFNSLALDTVKRKDIAARLVVIAREAGATTAVKCKMAISAFYAWAMASGLADENPVVGCRVKEPAPRDRVLTNAELAAVWNAADAADDEFGHIVTLLILTGQRRSEVSGMRWSELDQKAGTWTLPAERSKNNREHKLPLPAEAWRIIGAIARMAGRDHLFGARSSIGFNGFDASKKALDAALGDKVKPWRLHDIRRSVATGMADIGVLPHIVEEILNHQSGHRRGVAGTYNRSTYPNEVRAALAMWADHVISMAEGRGRKVLPFPAQAS